MWHASACGTSPPPPRLVFDANGSEQGPAFVNDDEILVRSASTTAAQRHERGMYLFGDQRPSPQAKRTLAAKGEAYRALTNGQRRFAPITMTDPRDHDGPIPVITMAEMRT